MGWLLDWREMSWPRRGLFLACCAFLIGYGIWRVVVWRMVNEPVIEAAEKILLAYENQQPGVLWFYSDLSENELLNLTKGKMDRLLREYYWPEMMGAKRTHREVMNATDSTVYELTQFYEVSGREVFLDFLVFKTPKGPKTNVVTPAIWTVMMKKFGEPHQNVTGPKRLYRIRADGIAADRKQLESLGIMGAKDNAPGKAIRKWESLEAGLRRMGYRETPRL